MDEKEKNVLGGFEAIIDNFIPRTEQEDNLEGLKDGLNVETQETIEDPVISKMKKDGTIKKDKKDSTEDEKPKDDEDEIIDNIEPVDDRKNTSKKTDQDKSSDGFDEQTMVNGFFDAIAEKLGWEGVTDEERPNDVESLIDYFSNLIEQESKPQYASDEIEALDNFVKQGGDLNKYLSIEAEINLDDINLEDEVNQKIVVKQLLKEKGFSDKQINKKIEKYVDAGLLEDEAQDAVEDLKEIKEQKKEQLLREQKKAYDDYVKQQRQFYNNVVDEIKNLNNIRGIAIPEKDKRTLIDYILKPDSDGMTKYQKDYRKGGIKNLIESAYFTMNADKLLDSAKRQGSNTAIEKLKNNLRNTSINTKTKNINNRSEDDTIWGSFTRHLRTS